MGRKREKANWIRTHGHFYQSHPPSCRILEELVFASLVEKKISFPTLAEAAAAETPKQLPNYELAL